MHLPSPTPGPEHGSTDRLRRVVAAVIRRHGRVLLCLRPAHKRHGGRWEFPGGKLRDGESRLEATRRELAEELGVRVTRVGSEAVAIRDPDSPHVIEFVDARIEGTPRPLEHPRLEWVPIADAASYPLAPADREFAERWLEGGRSATPCRRRRASPPSAAEDDSSPASAP